VYWVETRLTSAKPLLDVLMILPFGIPMVVLALSLVQIYNVPPHCPALTFLLMGAMVIYAMPFMYRPRGQCPASH